MDNQRIDLDLRLLVNHSSLLVRAAAFAESKRRIESHGAAWSSMESRLRSAKVLATNP
jgi:hypothetical protein